MLAWRAETAMTELLREKMGTSAPGLFVPATSRRTRLEYPVFGVSRN